MKKGGLLLVIFSLVFAIFFISFSSAASPPAPNQNVFVYKLIPEHENLLFVKMKDGQITSYPGVGDVDEENLPIKLNQNYQYNFGLIGAGYDGGALLDITYQDYMNLPSQPNINEYDVVTENPYVERYFCYEVSLENPEDPYNYYGRQATANKLNEMIDDGSLFVDCERVNFNSEPYFSDTINCIDSDGGSNIYEKGAITYSLYGAERIVEDSCFSLSQVFEMFCPENVWTHSFSSYSHKILDCPGKCLEGVCVEGDIQETEEIEEGINEENSEKIHNGDGTYSVNLEEQNTFIADNEWKLDITDYKEYGPYKTSSGIFFDVTSPEGVKYSFDFTLGNNPDVTYRVQVNSTKDSSEGVLEISIYNSHEEGYYSNKDVSISSLGDLENTNNKKTTSSGDSDGFFKKIWGWFKNLFSKKSIKENSKSSQSLDYCVVGEILTTNYPSGGIYGFEIKEVEQIETVKGDNLDMCCGEGGKNLKDTDTKYCYIKDGNTIIHSIFFNSNEGVLVKSFEKVYETINGNEVDCTYNFDDSGQIEGRDC
jgi:hypothetical protein